MRPACGFSDARCPCSVPTTMSMSDSDAEHLGCLQSLWRSVMSANATSDASDLWRHLQAYLDYADLCYWQWLVWLFYPLVLTFLLPVVVFISLYCCALFLHLYRMRALLRASASESYHDFWHGARRFISIMFEAQGKIWHSRSPPRCFSAHRGCHACRHC